MILVSGNDPGYAKMGVSLVTAEARPRCIAHKTIKSNPRMGAPAARLAFMHAELCAFYAEFGVPALIFAEDQRGVLAGMAHKGKRNSSSDQILRVCAMVQMVAHQLGAAFAEVMPGTLKAALGIKATGDDLKLAYRRVAHLHCPGGFDGDEHSSDAVAFGVVGVRHLRLIQNGLIPRTKKRR